MRQCRQPQASSSTEILYNRGCMFMLLLRVLAGKALLERCNSAHQPLSAHTSVQL